MFLVLALLFVKMGLNLLGVIDFLGLSWFRMEGFIELTIDNEGIPFGDK